MNTYVVMHLTEVVGCVRAKSMGAAKEKLEKIYNFEDLGENAVKLNGQIHIIFKVKTIE